MRHSLDKQVLPWWSANDPSPEGKARDVIAGPGSSVYVGAVWKVRIKRTIGQLETFTLDAPA